MPAASSLTLFACVAIRTVAISRYDQRLENRLILSEAESDGYPELWYKQTLNHFDSTALSTWSQRYYANFEHYKPGGPIFLYIGGEGALRSTSVSGRTANAYFAELFGGATVALEHRFYALHDLNGFSRWLAANSSLGDSKFFCMGGSYPGNLAAWYRQEFPEATAGCWASSAPVEAREDWPGYGQMVWRALSTDPVGVYDESLTTKLYAGYQQLAMFIQDPSPDTTAVVYKRLNACPGSMESQSDRDNWEASLMDGVTGVIQYNNTRAPHIADIRALAAAAPTPLEAALAVTDFLNVTQGDGPDGCADYSIAALYRSLRNATLPDSGAGNAGRTWFWQTCNEFGYFQTATAVWGKTSFYTRGASNFDIWQGMCSEIYGVSPAEVSARIASTNDYYGGLTPRVTNVVYSNGELDAWSLLSFTNESSPPAGGNSVVVGALGSHCVGLYAPEEGELPGATVVRDHVLERFQEWGAGGDATTV